MPSAAAKAHAANLEAKRKSVAEDKARQSGASIQGLLVAGARYARNTAAERRKDSQVIDTTKEAELPRFAKEELVLGKVLGRGGFGVVHEIVGFKTGVGANIEALEVTYHKRDEEIEDKVNQGKSFIAKHCLRKGGEARYAVKFLREDVCADPPQFIQGTIDFAVETSFLSSIEHPNIIKIRACATCDPFGDSYFIILDRLQETLEYRLATWAKSKKRNSGIIGKLVVNRKGSKTVDLLEKRLVAAFDLSAALGYLHERNIVYRDLKPENIGFDVRDDVKLFDFGLAKEINPLDKRADDTFELSGKTGSLRYMAPEVFLGKPYNLSVDAFSFSILLWEIMSLSTPYAGFSANMYREKVVMEGWRPPINESWPTSLRSLMKRGWSDEMYVRPPMSSVINILKQELIKLRDGDETGLEHFKRRSTHVFGRK